MFEHLNIRVNYNNADYSDLNFSKEDKAILRELGKEVSELASKPIMDEKKDYGQSIISWKKLGQSFWLIQKMDGMKLLQKIW